MSLVLPCPSMPPMCVSPLTVVDTTQFSILFFAPIETPTSPAACIPPWISPVTVRFLIIAPLMQPNKAVPIPLLSKILAWMERPLPSNVPEKGLSIDTVELPTFISVWEPTCWVTEISNSSFIYLSTYVLPLLTSFANVSQSFASWMMYGSVSEPEPEILPSVAHEGATARSEKISINAMRCPTWRGRM